MLTVSFNCNIRLNLFKYFLIHFDVLVCALAPAVVAFHSSDYEAVPVFAVSVSVETSSDGTEHIVGVIGLKGEAVTLAVTAVGDGVAETACFSDDGNCAVAQSHHL